MTDPLRFVPPRVQFVDLRTGMLSREWYLFLQGVFTRIGGADGTSTTDLEASLFEDAGSSETNVMLFDLEQTTGQQPQQSYFFAEQDTPPAHSSVQQMDNVLSELSALQDRMAELVKEVDSIKQGTLI